MTEQMSSKGKAIDYIQYPSRREAQYVWPPVVQFEPAHIHTPPPIGA